MTGSINKEYLSSILKMTSLRENMDINVARGTSMYLKLSTCKQFRTALEADTRQPNRNHQL